MTEGTAQPAATRRGLNEVLSGRAFLAVKTVQELESEHWSVGLRVSVKEDKAPGALLEGVVKGFDPESELFTVALDSTQDSEELVKVPQQRLIFSLPPTGELADPATPSCSSSGSLTRGASDKAEAVVDEPMGEKEELLAKAWASFLPGTRFEGTIAIPGLGMVDDDLPVSADRVEYTLEILEETVDELGGRFLLVRHAAYGDEQACTLTFEVGPSSSDMSPQVWVSYIDSETCCEGFLAFPGDDEGSCTVRGRVMQYAYGEEGFFERSEETTHFFELKKKTSCPAEAACNVRLERARIQRLEELCISAGAKQLDKKSLQMLTEIPWTDIVLRDAQRLCEGLFAKMRRQSSLLNSLVFETQEEKEAQLKRLKELGICRAMGHAATDFVMSRLRLLVTTSLFALGPEMSKVQSMLYKANIRVTKSFQIFDKSLRLAETRLPQSLVRSWVQHHPDAADTGSLCCVCFLALGAEEGHVQLPCKHWFHLDCVSKWLHGNSTCPTCRSDCGPKEAPDEEPSSSSSADQEMSLDGAERERLQLFVPPHRLAPAGTISG